MAKTLRAANESRGRDAGPSKDGWQNRLDFRDQGWWRDMLSSAKPLVMQKNKSGWVVFRYDWGIGRLLTGLVERGYRGAEFTLVAKHLFGLGRNKAFDLVRLVGADGGMDAAVALLKGQEAEAKARGIPYEPTWGKVFRVWFPREPKPVAVADAVVGDGGTVDQVAGVEPVTVAGSPGMQALDALNAELARVKSERDQAVAEVRRLEAENVRLQGELELRLADEPDPEPPATPPSTPTPTGNGDDPAYILARIRAKTGAGAQASAAAAEPEPVISEKELVVAERDGRRMLRQRQTETPEASEYHRKLTSWRMFRGNKRMQRAAERYEATVLPEAWDALDRSDQQRFRFDEHVGFGV